MDITDVQHGHLLRGQHCRRDCEPREAAPEAAAAARWSLLGVPLVWFWFRELSGDPIGLGLPPIISDNPELSILRAPARDDGRDGVPAVRGRRQVAAHAAAPVGLQDPPRRCRRRRSHTSRSDRHAQPVPEPPDVRRRARRIATRGVCCSKVPPGTGKTYLAKALAAEAGVPFLFVSASEFQSMFYGQTNRKIRSFFKAIRKAARAEGGAIGFIEEFDAIGGARAGMGANRRPRRQRRHRQRAARADAELRSADRLAEDRRRSGSTGSTACCPESMALMRATSSTTANVLLIAATNRAADLDPALLRPGRFDRIVHFDLPPHADRKQIAAYYLDRKKHEAAVTADFIADVTGGYTPVRIERLLDEALIIAVRNGRRAMDLDDVVEAQLTTEVGLAHEVGYHPDERSRVAIHEAGHALTAALCCREIRIASILRRGGALGLVSHGDADERFLQTPSDAQDLIAIALAGRAAEMQELGEASSGVSSDLQYATTIACQLVGQFGAGDSLISLDAAAMPGANNLVAKVLADEPSRKKVDSILNASADRAACMVLEYRDALMAIARALLESDELSGGEVHAIVTANARSAAA